MCVLTKIKIGNCTLYDVDGFYLTELLNLFHAP